MEQDLRKMVREFRASVSADLAAMHEEITGLGQQITEVRDEVRARITTSETAILNAVRDLGRDTDRRLVGVETRLGQAESRLQRLEDAQGFPSGSG